ncbi:MAG: hypothetical protein ACRDT6_25855, partial [Micromonosporaceae bacterium]
MAGDLSEWNELGHRAPAGAVVFSAVIPVMEVVVIGHRIGLVPQLWAVALTACYLPGYLALVHHAARGTRMRYRYGPLAALAVIAIAAALSPPLTGTWFAVVALGVAALLVLRLPWSLLLAAAGIAAQTSWVLAYGPGPGPAIWRGFSLVWSVAAVYSVVWLVGVMRRLALARATLADNAVAQERVRTEQQLRRTLGGALASVGARGEQAAVQLREEPALVPGTVERLAGESRATLAEARRVIAELSRGSVGAEFDTARSLLAAAGLRTTLTGSAAGTDDEQVRTTLRAAVS